MMEWWNGGLTEPRKIIQNPKRWNDGTAENHSRMTEQLKITPNPKKSERRKVTSNPKRWNYNPVLG